MWLARPGRGDRLLTLVCHDLSEMNAETVYKYVAKDKAPTDGYQHAAHVMVYAKFQEKLFLGKYDCKYAILVNTSMP